MVFICLQIVQLLVLDRYLVVAVGGVMYERKKVMDKGKKMTEPVMGSAIPETLRPTQNPQSSGNMAFPMTGRMLSICSRKDLAHGQTLISQIVKKKSLEMRRAVYL